jgi:hypothetical protein
MRVDADQSELKMKFAKAHRLRCRTPGTNSHSPLSALMRANPRQEMLD